MSVDLVLVRDVAVDSVPTPLDVVKYELEYIQDDRVDIVCALRDSLNSVLWESALPYHYAVVDSLTFEQVDL